MEDDKKMFVVGIMKEIMESSSSSSSCSETASSDDEDVRDDRREQQVIFSILSVGSREMDPIPRIAGFTESVVPSYSKETFKGHFRMLPETFNEVLHLIGPALETTRGLHGSGRRPLPAEKQLLLALWYMGTPDCYRSVCEKFGVGKATALRTIRRVSYALHCLAPSVIMWPSGEEVQRVKEAFAAKSGFPGIVGAIDGTHIKITAPRVDPQSYVTRKDVHAIHLQAVCNDKACFTHCLAGNAASIHDARILKNSAVAQYLAAGETYFPQDGHLIGDGAYGIHPHMMVPFRDNGHLGQQQRDFNNRLSVARQVIERAFGLLKGRFRSLKDNLPLTDMVAIPQYILACCVLHNICMKRGDIVADAEDPLDPVDVPVVEGLEVGSAHARTAGQEKRQHIMNNL